MAVNRKGATRLHSQSLAERETLTMDSDDEDLKTDSIKFRDDDEGDGGPTTKGKNKKKTVKVKKSGSFVKNLMKGRFKSKKHEESLQNAPSGPTPTNLDVQPIFGVPLDVAIDRSSNADDICLPRVVYECIQYLEKAGIRSEGIYRISGTKSKIMAYKAQYDSVGTIDFSTADPDSVAGLLKQYLRELPCNLLTTELNDKFEDACVASLKSGAIEDVKALVRQLPIPNRTLICWIIKHVANVIKNENFTKMTLPNMVIVLGPTLHLPTPVITVLLNHVDDIFNDSAFETSLHKSAEQAVESLNKEITDLESQLHSLHDCLHKLPNSGKEYKKKSEMLWEVQRKLTDLSRQRRLASKVYRPLDQTVTIESDDKEKLEESIQSNIEDDSVEISDPSSKFENEELTLLNKALLEKINDEKKLIESLKGEIASLTEQLQEKSDIIIENGEDTLSDAEQAQLFEQLTKENQELELHVNELFTKIHDQRQACVDLQVQIKLLEKELQNQDSIEEARF